MQIRAKTIKISFIIQDVTSRLTIKYYQDCDKGINSKMYTCLPDQFQDCDYSIVLYWPFYYRNWLSVQSVRIEIQLSI